MKKILYRENNVDGTSIQKTPEETLESVLNEIELVRGEYCTGKNDLADGGRIVLDALIKRLKG